MRIAVTGAKGRLGSELVNYWDCIPIHADVVSGVSNLKRELQTIKPDVVIHCASITNVDDCENKLAERASQVNVYGTRNLRETFTGRIIYISTDYIFDGQKGPYSEQAIPNPIGHYGATKLAGEAEIELAKKPSDTVVRTTILYGQDRKKPNFVKSILTKLAQKEPCYVTTKISGTPTYIPHLAEALIEICYRSDLPRIVNVAGKDVLSRYEFALMIGNVFGYGVKLVNPLNELPGKANRPRKAGLRTRLAIKYGLPIYHVHEGLECMRDE